MLVWPLPNYPFDCSDKVYLGWFPSGAPKGWPSVITRLVPPSYYQVYITSYLSQQFLTQIIFP